VLRDEGYRTPQTAVSNNGEMVIGKGKYETLGEVCASVPLHPLGYNCIIIN
jgi:hypothetical protein